MDLFQQGTFTLRGGTSSGYKIECDALSPKAWAALAQMASEILLPFGTVEGVPRGGIPFAEALAKYADPTSKVLLIAEDVVTTGRSMEEFRNGRIAIGVAAFARGPCPDWVVPVFNMTRMGQVYPKPRLVQCRKCHGRGLVPCECEDYDVRTVEGHPLNEKHCDLYGSREGFVVKQCRRCQRVCGVRYQWDPGTGSDDSHYDYGIGDPFELAKEAKC